MKNNKINLLSPLIVTTGKFTGRSPKDRYIVDHQNSTKKIDWGERNKKISLLHYQYLYNDIIQYLQLKKNFLFEGNVCADKIYGYAVQLQTEIEWYTKFSSNIFRQDHRQSFWKCIKIYHAPNFRAHPSSQGVDNKNFVIINLEELTILIGGTGYAGEIKKSVFSLLNYHLPDQDVFPMHCSANYDDHYGTTLYFGLSGTGKTTLASDKNKRLIGDDEHGWSSNGIFNFEGGCYAKVYGLNKKKEPEIYQATMSPTSIIENAVIKKGKIDFLDKSITENTRSCYPLSVIKNYFSSNQVQSNIAPVPNTILLLACDAFGVLPPVSKLTVEQAIFYFILGYTSKIPGTETNILEPRATFSPCFGAPFMPRYIGVYAKLFERLLTIHQSSCWLINTGWWGGSYEVGIRIDLSITRSIVEACITNSFAKENFITSKYFNLSYPKNLPNNPFISLNPEEKWKDKKAYQQNSMKLVKLFKQNFKN